jgi:hypothetical protein
VELTDPDDRKLAVLARSARARTRADEGAAVRDLDGRTYAAATVDLPSLQVSALGVAVSMAVSSGASGLEAAVVVGDGGLSHEDVAVVRDFAGGGVPVHRCGPDGRPVGREDT